MLAPRLTAVVVFPTPPFWFVIARTLPIGAESTVRSGRKGVRGRTGESCPLGRATPGAPPGSWRFRLGRSGAPPGPLGRTSVVRFGEAVKARHGVGGPIGFSRGMPGQSR